MSDENIDMTIDIDNLEDYDIDPGMVIVIDEIPNRLSFICRDVKTKTACIFDTHIPVSFTEN